MLDKTYRMSQIVSEKEWNDEKFESFLREYMFMRTARSIYDENKDENTFVLDLHYYWSKDDKALGYKPDLFNLDVKVSGWTKVEDALPKTPMDVLVTVELPSGDRAVIPAFYGSSYKISGEICFLDVCTYSPVDAHRLKILAWMPVPGPYGGVV